MGVSKNNGTPKSSILIGFSIINHPFWGTIIFGNTHILYQVLQSDLVWTRKWPFQGLSDLQFGSQKVTLKKLVYIILYTYI